MVQPPNQKPQTLNRILDAMTAPPNHSTHIPDKLFFRIGEVSRIVGVPASVLRFWESEFPRIKPQRTDSGQRVYRRADVELILTIKHLLYDQNFTIKGARKYLKTRKAADPSPDRGDLVAELRSELQQIKDLLI
jgi:DNA-binding transcriptional MerR regulator